MQNSIRLTLDPGNPIRFAKADFPLQVRSLLITMLHGGSGIGYILNDGANPSVALVKSDQTLVTELAPATATEPGGVFSWDRTHDGQSLIDLPQWGIDGDQADPVQVSWELAV